MAERRIVFLMYHELELSGRALCQSEPGYARYILPLATFSSQMEWIKQSDFRGLNVSQALTYPAQPSVCITFDDGCETDLIAAAPVLHEFGLSATFYVTTGFLDTRGYMSAAQLRELDSQGFEIGCHSMTHAYLSDVNEADLKREIVDAKSKIEQIVGHNIKHFSCPGGRYSNRTLDRARRAGFQTVANSEFRANTPSTNAYHLGRIALLRDLPISQFDSLCHGRGLWKKQLSHGARRGVQRLLGNKTYDRVRSALLGEPR
jgi:peptidoglycan/xylan/chitin deacetylase (PgdA/CDA1 family)